MPEPLLDDPISNRFEYDLNNYYKYSGLLFVLGISAWSLILLIFHSTIAQTLSSNPDIDISYGSYPFLNIVATSTYTSLFFIFYMLYIATKVIPIKDWLYRQWELFSAKNRFDIVLIPLYAFVSVMLLGLIAFVVQSMTMGLGSDLNDDKRILYLVFGFALSFIFFALCFLRHGFIIIKAYSIKE